MSTLGWVFLLMGFTLVRGLTRGRGITESLGDVTDAARDAIRGDTAGVREALTRSGSTTGDAQAAASSVGGPAGAGAQGTGVALLARMKALGEGKPYRWGWAGPDGYDCSGLVWRAMKDLGIYSGPRFTTHTYAIQMRKISPRVDGPIQVGDVLVWQAPGHMGVAESPTTFYSALSRRSGIKSLPISYRRSRPRVYRIASAGIADNSSSANAAEHAS
jgi:cell wall-associated NlpC family hydrolase